MEDKIIREKIDSLLTLPEGYAPSLDSKWELLQAGLERKKRSFPLYWTAIAAGFLLLIGFAWMMMKKDMTIEAPAIVNIEKNSTPAKAVEEQDKEITFIEEKNTSHINVYNRPGQNPFIVIPKHEQVEKDLKIDNEAVVVIQETLFVKEAPAIVTNIAKSKKKRFVEMEFSDPPQSNSYIEAQADAGIRIRLMPQQQYSFSPPGNESPSVKLKKSF